MFSYVIYTKNTETYKKGDVCLYHKDICEELIKAKLVKYYKSNKEV